ncbi:tyrosine-type recombinase/integrase [Clostridium tunisiense]|uniref:tyrosine-type recombinase/integrase n=1 Tax=Clostridium tunisiense TaxID=219748 RepID=UPI00031F01AC|nr:site-specific integrase [Clostridium tunisiense]
MARKLKIKSNNNLTFKEGFEEFLDSCKARNLRPATIKHYEESYKSIIRFVDEEMFIKDISHKTIDKFDRDSKENLDIKSQTLFTYTRDLKTIINYFIKLDYLNQFKIKLPEVDKAPIETYSDAELKVLLKKPDLNKVSFAQYRDWVIINFLLSTGVRLNSFINIKIKDLDFENEVVYVNVTKNRKPLIIPLNSTIIKILKDYLKIRQHQSDDEFLFCTVFGTQLSKRTISTSLYQYNRERGIFKTGIHRYRHTFAKKFITIGGNLAILQKILGHSSLLITQNYLNMLISDLKKEMNEFNILNEFRNEHIKIKK